MDGPGRDGESATEGIIELKDLRIPVRNARLYGWLYEDGGGGPCWSIEISGRAHRFGDEEFSQLLRPRFYDESMPLRVDDWRRLEGQAYRFRWQDDETEGDSLPTLYLCSHEGLTLSDLSLGARTGHRFALHWSGLAEANWDEDYGREMPFRIELSIPFIEQEVRFWQHDDEDFETAARTIMRHHGLSDAHLRYREYRRFSDDPGSEHYRLVRTLFDPVG
ncbi:hypothetical protein [Marilutibacter chinensis]|uniref:Uncharacterized protein n=1 Tax=Marilutibacter chinensis TaxID=2912247 RepID=A0ABS9HUD8_9GAMM|nr:hypothetical protein [Lysobacter chinensis]MCF7222116.1 hypothetical protein [Lysobacter chinensis]